MADERRREPRAATTRLTGEMQVPNAEHGQHDPLLVVSLLDRPTDGPERRRGEALVANCAECAALQQDLIALRVATRSLPTPTRVRDYSLSPEDARRLRRTGWRRLVAVFGSTRDAFSRPLAIGLTTIGLAGLLVATVPGAPSGGASTAALPTVGQAVGGAGSGANSESLEGTKEAPGASAGPSAPGPAAAALAPPSAAPTNAAAPAAPSGAPEPSGEAFDTFIGSPEPSVGAAGVAPQPEASAPSLGAQRAAAPSDAVSSEPIDRLAAVALAGLVFAAGLGLFALRWAARRV